MDYPVIKGTGYALVNAPDMVIHNGTTQTVERVVNAESEYLGELPSHIRTYDQVLAYIPNQVFIGNREPGVLRDYALPWYGITAEAGERFGKFGEIMPQDEFIGLMKISDAFGLVILERQFSETVREKLMKHPLFEKEAGKLNEGAEMAEIEKIIEEQHAEPLYHNGKRVGCVKRAHDIDTNLSAHILFENLVVKASGVLALKHMTRQSGVSGGDIEYVIECSEEACGDMNQRGGGNFAKSIAEVCGLANASGSDTRGFCAAPVHALIEAATLVQSGVYANVAVVAGGSTAKLGMNGKDHVKKGMPVLEDVIGSFAVLVGRNDDINPVIRTDVVGRHTVGTGSSPQAVMTSLVAAPLDKSGLKLTDVDRYSVEMQNPDITKAAGAGDVPEANYKMIAALGVGRKELERDQIPEFVIKHGMVGWAPTQGHIPSGIPYLGFARQEMLEGKINKVMVVGKGSLFLGRMTNLFDGVSVLIEKNSGKKAGAHTEGHDAPEAKPVIGVTTIGSELGEANVCEGIAAMRKKGVRTVAIGNTSGFPGIESERAESEEEAHKIMEALLEDKKIDAAVTMHYNFPIGVSTVGRVVTPAKGREMFIASTTGTPAADRIEGMVRSAVYGIITAKTCGIEYPTVGIANVEGARQVEMALNRLSGNGYEIRFAESARADGGCVMRGNDLLSGSADVMVMDSLTGNLMMKIFSAFSTGGIFESAGYGYGPGIGENHDKLILIISRASGAPVISNAIEFAAEMVRGNWRETEKDELRKVREAGFEDVIRQLKAKRSPEKTAEAGPSAAMPGKEIVTEEIAGIDIMEIEAAAGSLWQEGIYAESGMGCTGPVILVNESKAERAREILIKNNYIMP